MSEQWRVRLEAQVSSRFRLKKKASSELLNSQLRSFRAMAFQYCIKLSLKKYCIKFPHRKIPSFFGVGVFFFEAFWGWSCLLFHRERPFGWALCLVLGRARFRFAGWGCPPDPTARHVKIDLWWSHCQIYIACVCAIVVAVAVTLVHSGESMSILFWNFISST